MTTMLRCVECDRHMQRGRSSYDAYVGGSHPRLVNKFDAFNVEICCNLIATLCFWIAGDYRYATQSQEVSNVTFSDGSAADDKHAPRGFLLLRHKCLSLRRIVFVRNPIATPVPIRYSAYLQHWLCVRQSNSS